MNHLIISGRLGKDAKYRDYEYERNGRKNEYRIYSFSIAVDTASKTGTITDWYDCEFWALKSRAVFLDPTLVKGTKVVIEGALKTDTYTTTDEKGQSKCNYKTIIKVNDIEVMSAPRTAQAKVEDLPVDDDMPL